MTSLYRSLEASRTSAPLASMSGSKAVTTPTFHRPFETTNGHTSSEHARNRDPTPHRPPSARSDSHRLSTDSKSSARSLAQDVQPRSSSKASQRASPKQHMDASLGQLFSDFHAARPLELAAHLPLQQTSALSNLQSFSRSALDGRHHAPAHKPERRASPKDSAAAARVNGAHAPEKRKRSVSGEVTSRTKSPRKPKATSHHEKPATPTRANG